MPDVKSNSPEAVSRYSSWLSTVIITYSIFFSWIKHNIAKLAQIDASDLSQLFNANRAFLLQDWLSQTRKLKAEHKDYVNHPLQMSLIDKN